MTRTQTIIDLRMQGKTFKEIAEVYDITAERARQIALNEKQSFCLKHKTSYKQVCEYCNLEAKYKKIFNSYSKKNLINAAERFQAEGREKSDVIVKRIAAQILRNKYNLTYRELATIFDRDHSSMVKLVKGA